MANSSPTSRKKPETFTDAEALAHSKKHFGHLVAPPPLYDEAKWEERRKLDDVYTNAFNACGGSAEAQHYAGLLAVRDYLCAQSETAFSEEMKRRAEDTMRVLENDGDGGMWADKEFWRGRARYFAEQILRSRK